MKRELEESARERERLQWRIERLERQNARLKRELDAARRAGCRQAAPFAKTVTPEPKRPGRRAGAQYGQPARRCRPTRVDVRHDVPLPPSCPDCGGRVRSTGMATQISVDSNGSWYGVDTQMGRTQEFDRMDGASFTELMPRPDPAVQ